MGVSLCFICELPIHPHQSWHVWKVNLLSPTGVVTSSEGTTYVNNVYHEDCLVCTICNLRLKTPSPTASRDSSGDPEKQEQQILQSQQDVKRFGNKIYCPLHFADVSGSNTGGEEFMAKLRDFKRHSLGFAEARRKSSTTLSFPVPVQACPGSAHCSQFPHGIKDTPGYWIECRGGKDPSKEEKDGKTSSTGSYKTTDHNISSEKEARFLSSGLDRSSILRGAASSESLYVRPKLERAESSRCPSAAATMTDRSERVKEDQRPNTTTPPVLVPPTIQIMDASYGKTTKDDMELVRRKGPNIIITMPAASSPPLSPMQNFPPPTNLFTDDEDEMEESPGGGVRRRRRTQSLDEPFELLTFQEEMFEKHFHNKEHWNYFTNDESLGPVLLSLKQEILNNRDMFRLLLRTVSYSLHGLIPASSIAANRYDREAVVKELSDAAGLKPGLILGQLQSTADELLKLDQVFIKSELKVGVIYIKEGQVKEEDILGNKIESNVFKEFLSLLGDRIKLKGFDKYKGGLDTVHDLTGSESVYTHIKGIEIMFHVSTMLPHEENDQQKLQKKRHIGNDIVCVAFIEDDDTYFWPACIKSHFLHTFIVVKTSAKETSNGDTRKYQVSVVCRDEVSAFKPYLWHESTFEKVRDNF